MAKSPFEIDTKGVCLICLTSNNCHIYDEKEINGDSTTPTAFKMFLHYLKVDLRKVTLGSASNVEASRLQNVKLSVFLCGDCSSVANEFLDLYQQFENTRLEMDLRVRQLNSFMENGSQDPERVLEFEKRVNAGKMQARIGSVLVDKLRQEALERAGQRVQKSLARIPFTDLAAELEEMDNAANFSPIPFRDEGEKPLDQEEQFQQTEQPEIKPRCGAYEYVNCVHSDSEEDERMDMGVSNEITTEQTKKACNASEIPGVGLEFNLRAVSEEFVSEDTVSAEEGENMNAFGIVQHENGNTTNEVHQRASLVEKMESVDAETGSGSSVVFVTEIEMNENAMSIEHEILHGKSSATAQVERMNSVGPLDSSELTTSKRWKCVYCDKSCSIKRNLLTHQLLKHATALLSDQGLLPPAISESQLEATLATHLNEQRATSIKCPFPICESKPFQGKSYLRIHLVQQHFQEIVKQAQNVPMEDGGPYFKGQKSEWKCISCRKYFSTYHSHQSHLIRLHTSTYLSNQGGLPPGMSEEQLENSLEAFLGQVQDYSWNFQCPLCGKSGFQKRKSNLRRHLLQTHLQEVLANVSE